MLGKTHHAGGTVAALLAFEIMRANGWLIPDCNETIQLLMMYPFASFGSIFPDLDQNDDAQPSKDPVAIAINKVLRLTGAKHRSWQTHSLLVTGGFCFLLFALVFFGNAFLGVTGAIDWAFLRLASIGFIAGILSHLILDAFSMAGIHVWPGFKVRFVPKSSAFKTGGKWETIVFYVLIVILVLLIGKIFVIDIINWVKTLSFDFSFSEFLKDLGINFDIDNEILKNLLKLNE